MPSQVLGYNTCLINVLNLIWLLVHNYKEGKYGSDMRFFLKRGDSGENKQRLFDHILINLYQEWFVEQ